MFLPNTIALWRRRTGVNDYDEPVWGAPVRVPCAIVHLGEGAQKSSVRTDSSASRGNVVESVADAKLLFPITVKLSLIDQIEIFGVTLQASRIEPRNNVLGRLDHYEVDFIRVRP